jgi:hypothetical protein
MNYYFLPHLSSPSTTMAKFLPKSNSRSRLGGGDHVSPRGGLLVVAEVRDDMGGGKIMREIASTGKEHRFRNDIFVILE